MARQEKQLARKTKANCKFDIHSFGFYGDTMTPHRTDANTSPAPVSPALHNQANAALILADGTIYLGRGAGAKGVAVAELCFNTAMTGYQEILCDPSYAGQIITFTFPHIGNVGANSEDEEASGPRAKIAARGAVLRCDISTPSNWRAEQNLHDWLVARNIIAISGVDTRAITRKIQREGMVNALIAHGEPGGLDLAALALAARQAPSMDGAELVSLVTSETAFTYSQPLWSWRDDALLSSTAAVPASNSHVVVMDFGVKQNILRALNDIGARVSVVPAHCEAAAILALKPDGVVLSNGPGDPAACNLYAGATIRALIEARIPIFGICLGHQMLALACGARTTKMRQGHHGANHPVQDLRNGKVEIVSMNHGFAVDAQSLPAGVRETHRSLFDGSNCGLELEGSPAFSVQYHPEASPGPQDSLYLFRQFADMMRA